MDKMDSVVQMVVDLIKRDYKSIHDVPAHSRWRHFDVGGRLRARELIDGWLSEGIDVEEQVRRLLDLFVVSVLVDAGAGDKWQFLEPSNDGKSKVYVRSEGLAVASWHMFLQGKLSSDPRHFPHRVDAEALEKLTTNDIEKAFQVNGNNPLVGVEGRTMLLNRLGTVIKSRPEYFQSKTGESVFRPGNLLDYLLHHSSTKTGADNNVTVEMETFWHLIIDGFGGIWPPSRTKIGSTPMGDVWPCSALSKTSQDKEAGHLVAFHKLSQWLTYSLMEPMSKLLNIRFNNMQLMTGLAEYRNGGLFVDMGILGLKKATFEEGLVFANQNGQVSNESVPLFEVQHPAIIEWRALTVALLDVVGAKVCKLYELTQEQLPLVCVLEGGTWKAGREIAAKKRPRTKGPPIQIKSDGTVF